MTYDPTWIRKSPILIPQAIQNDSLTAQKGSVRLDALDWGQKVGSQTLDSASGGSKSISLQQLTNGKMFVAWAASTDGRYSIVDSDGNMDSTAYNTFETGSLLDSTTNYGIATALLPDGNVVLAYAQDQGAENAVVFKIYNESGSIVRDTVTVKTHASETDFRIGVSALPDGRFVIVWNESVVGAMSYFAIYDSDGDVVKGYTSLGGNYANPQVAPLSDGNWIVTYENSGLRFRTYDRQGIQILGETLFKTGVTQAPGMRTMGNGQVLVPFTRGFGIVDRDGNVVVVPDTKEAAGTYSVTVLPHDNIVAQNNNGTNAYYKIYDSKGTLLNTQVTYATDANSILSGNVATFKNGNFMLVYVAGTSNTVKMFVHQGTKAGFGGDLTISGALSLATGTSVNEISTDDTLASDSDDILSTQKAVKGYVDGQIGSTSYRIFQSNSEVVVNDDGSDATSSVTVNIDGASIAVFTDDGLQLSPSLGGDNVAITSFSNDTSLGGYNKTSTTGNGDEDVVPTERAVRAYIDGLTSSQNEPTGFPLGNSDSVTTIGIDGSNSVYIEPVGASYDVFMNGQRWVKTTKESVTITDVEGVHYVYFDTDGVLKETTTFDINILYTKGYVAIVYWDAVNKEINYFGDERHGCTMDGKTHANIHLSRGTLYNSGLALADITADGTGATDVEAQFSYSNGLITDEDITHTIAAQSLPAQVPVFYMNGNGAIWRKQAAGDYPIVNTGTGRVGWNKFELGSWAVQEATNNYFVLMHLYATNDVNGAEMAAIMGQAEYATIVAARAGAADEINSITKGEMPFAEFHPVATLIFETSDSFTNTPKAIIRTNEDGNDWTDWRTSGLTPGAGSITDHGSLSGLANDDHLQYFLVNGTRNVTGNLTVEGTTDLQGNTQVSSGTFELANGTTINEFSTDGTLAGDSDDAVPTEQAVKTYVDNSIGNLNPDKIWEGDSSVEVFDDGTSTPRVDFTVDATLVGSFNATTQTVGKDAESKVVVSDNDVTVYGGAAAALQATFNADGLTLNTGASINEFSTDETLADDSDDAVPTEKAVKGYVDTAIANLNPDKIWEGNSKVEVIDDGTAAGYVEIVADGVQVGYFDAQSSTQRIGKASGAGRLEVADASITGFIGTANRLSIEALAQRLGNSSNTYLAVNQTAHTITAFANTSDMLLIGSSVARFGTTATNFSMSELMGMQIATIDVNSIRVLSCNDDNQSFGVSGDSRLTLDQSTDTVELYAGTVNVLNATPTSQRFGAAGDTNLTLNTSADTFTLSAGANTQISGGLTSLSLGVSGDTTITLDQSTDSVSITAGGQSQILVETSGTTVYDDLTVTGDLFVDGTTFVVNQTEVRTADNVIVVNYGEPGAGVTAGTAGMQVDRGTLPDYYFVFAEATDTFRIGELGDTQAVATREDNPELNTVPWWNDTEKRFDTAGDTAITVDQTSNTVVITANTVDAFTVTSSGITLSTGATISEFSTDGSLAGDSNTAVPTEAAVKAYVDAQIGGSSNWIFEDDSYVKVTDDGTSAGYIDIVADAVNVSNFNTTTQRIGKAAGAGRLEITDTAITGSIAADTLLSIEADTQTLGLSTDTYLRTAQSTNAITAVAGATTVLSLNDTNQRLGVEGDTELFLDQDADTVDIYAGATLVVDLGTTSQVFGVDGDSRLALDQTADTAKLYAGASLVVDANPDVQVFGIGADTCVTIDQTANTIVVSENQTNVATFAEAGLTLQAGATIDEFSIDGTLAGDSDTAVPTEQAVKTYVDNAIGNLNPDKIWEGDSYVEVIDDGTAAGYVSVVADGVEVAHFDAQSSTQRIGKLAESRILVADDDVKVYAGATVALQATFNANGFALATGVTVNTISDSTAMGTSSTSLITQAAAKSYIDSGDSSAVSSANGYTDTEIGTLTTYVNNEFADTTAYIDVQDASTLSTANTYTDVEIDKLRNELDLVNVRVVTSDTTAVSGDILLVDTTGGDVNVEMVEANDSRIIIKKKTTDGNKVNISTTPGTIDGQNLIIIDTPYQSFTFVSDGTNFYII